MSNTSDHGSNWQRVSTGPPLPQWFGILLAWIITLGMFCGVAIVIDRFLADFPYYWRACSAAFASSGFLEILQKTVLSSLSSAISSYKVAIYNPTYLFAGLATAIYGTFRGRPPLIVPTLTWVIVYSILTLLGVANLETTIAEVVNDWPFFITGIFLTTFCWFVSKRFW